MSGKRRPCPSCSSKSAFSESTDERGTVGFCHRCGYTESENYSATRDRPPIPKATPPRLELDADGIALWNSCRPLGGAALAYLKARHCVIPPADGHLRWCDSLRHWRSGYEGPALVALVTHAVDARPMTLHYTWVRADGSKAPVDPPRLLRPNHSKRGGVVRLWPDGAVTRGLAVGEGIETMLCAAHAFQPVWSCLDAGNVGQLPVLAGIECLSIFADADIIGIAAAQQCAERWVAAGREVFVTTPLKAGADIADVVSL